MSIVNTGWFVPGPAGLVRAAERRSQGTLTFVLSLASRALAALRRR
jgi:hypothetical protein